LAQSLEAARQALAARDEFLQMASHQLRTPIASMQMTIDNAIRALDGPPARERIARALNLLDEQTGHLTRLVTELLSFVVVEAGRLQFARGVVNVTAVVERAVRALTPMLNAAGCTVSIDAPPDCAIDGDAFWLEQAVGNLLANAAKYGARHPVNVTVTAEEARARVEVKDRGIGIAIEDQERIFQPFQRAVSPEHFGGLGIGLCVVKRVVEGHGGAVEVRSGPGEGASFVLNLPR
jgi:signal transduction histidine kinase